MWLSILLIALATYCLYHYVIFRNWNYFDKCDVKCVKGLPILGSFYKLFFGQASLADILNEHYQKYPDEQIIGLFEFFGKKMYMLRDPELIKQITIKDFVYVMNHRWFIDKQVEPLFGRSLLVLRDQEWRTMRSTLSPMFTGSKMRLMFPLIVECTNNLMTHLSKLSRDTGGQTFELELKDLFTRFANDTIASCAFGLKTNAINNRNDEFYKTGKVVSNFNGVQGAKLFGYSSIPMFMKYFAIKLFPTKVANYFRNVVINAINDRLERNVIRNDLINLLLLAKAGKLTDDHQDIHLENKLTDWEDDDIVAQCILFFFAGYDTTSTLMCFMIYELALNSIIQQKLYDEILKVNSKCGEINELTYEKLQEMKYLTMFTTECLRKWPAASVTDRYVNKPYTFKTKSGKTIQLNVGDILLLPIISIQRDAKYFPNPDRLDPERFDDKDKVNSESYLSFGSGPRNCIGSRFALMECKTVLYYLMLKFRFETCTRTTIPFEYRRYISTIDAAHGFWIQFNLR